MGLCLRIVTLKPFTLHSKQLLLPLLTKVDRYAASKDSLSDRISARSCTSNVCLRSSSKLRAIVCEVIKLFSQSFAPNMSFYLPRPLEDLELPSTER